MDVPHVKRSEYLLLDIQDVSGFEARIRRFHPLTENRTS